MNIKSLELIQYRNITSFNSTFSNGVNLFIGNNAQGKTNLIESIYIVGTTKSFKKAEDSNLINFNQEKTIIKAITIKNDFESEVKFVYSRFSKKQITHNNKIVNSLSNYLGNFSTVLFVPEDLDIIKGEASNRRRFLDILLCQTDKTYLMDLIHLQKVLRQRNCLLKELRKNKERINELESWNDQLFRYSARICFKRLENIKKIEQYANKINSKIEKNETLKIDYMNSISNESNINEGKYIEIFKDEIKKRYAEEIIRGTTVLGPHRDDLDIKINNKSGRYFGSQGQQRSIAISLRLAEIEYYNVVLHEYPVLLLDDVFSELDDNRKKEIIKLLDSNVQIFISGTNFSEFNDLTKQAMVFKIHSGKWEGTR